MKVHKEFNYTSSQTHFIRYISKMANGSVLLHYLRLYDANDIETRLSQQLRADMIAGRFTFELIDIADLMMEGMDKQILKRGMDALQSKKGSKFRETTGYVLIGEWMINKIIGFEDKRQTTLRIERTGKVIRYETLTDGSGVEIMCMTIIFRYTVT